MMMIVIKVYFNNKIKKNFIIKNILFNNNKFKFITKEIFNDNSDGHTL